MSRYRSNRALVRGLYGWLVTAAALAAAVGVSGWAMPDLPVIGPFVQKLLANRQLAMAPAGPAAPGSGGRTQGAPVEGATGDRTTGDRTTGDGAVGDATVGDGAVSDGPAAEGASRDGAAASGGANAGVAGVSSSGSKAARGTGAGAGTGLSLPVQPGKGVPGAAAAGKGGGSRPSAATGAASGATAFPPASGQGGAGNPLVPGAPGAAGALNSPMPPPGAAAAPTDRISIASYNIQVFGTSKLQQGDVLEILAQTVRQFDLVAIQEIRSRDDTVLPRFLQVVNAEGGRYDYVIGPRLGRTNSKEQYAFVFNTQRIEVDSNSITTVEDPRDLLHREPLVARFRARTQPPEAGFTFWLANIHTDPDEVPQEVDALADVFTAVANANPQEDDVILLGDLNADETQLGRLGTIPGITWIVPRATPTNTRGTKTYDNLLFLREATAEFTGRWGVVNMQRAFQLSMDDALRVSDHLPVWGEFSVWEVPPTPVGGGAPFAPR